MINKGSKVEYIGVNEEAARLGYLPAEGIFGEVVDFDADDKNYAWVKWPEGTTTGDGVWCAHVNNLKEA
jgi:hypothetical protein